MPSPHEGTPVPAEPTDEDLDRYIRTRLALIGVDLSVLPRDDPGAPADQRRVLRSARNLLRTTVPVLSDYELDPQSVPPAFYPAALPSVIERRGEVGHTRDR
jgi:hypothetical protein